MVKRVAVVIGDDKERADLCAALCMNLFQASGFQSLSDFETTDYEFDAVIFDLSLPLTNGLFEQFRKRMPNTPMIAISNRNFHPELRESLSTCITACLSKPVDLNELIYLLKGI